MKDCLANGVYWLEILLAGLMKSVAMWRDCKQPLRVKNGLPLTASKKSGPSVLQLQGNEFYPTA